MGIRVKYQKYPLEAPTWTNHPKPTIIVVRDAITKHHKLGGLKDSLLSHNSGGQKFKIKVLAMLVPSEGYEGRICSMVFLLDL